MTRPFRFADPPNPGDPRYRQDPTAYMKANYEWSRQLMSELERHSSESDRSTTSPYVFTNFATSTSLDCTNPTAVQVANILATLVADLRALGKIKGVPTNKSGAYGS